VDLPEDMPAGLRRLWVPQGGDEPHPRPGLSVRRIVQAAIELADAGGLDAVSMSRVAQRLGYTTMSLYRYVANKDELLVLMHDSAWQLSTEPERPVGPAGGWRARLTLWCRAQRAVLLAHPWLEGIRVTERMGTPSQLTWMDRGLQALADTPLTEYEKSQALLTLNGLLFWDARVLADFAAAMRDGGLSVQEMSAAYGRALAALADSERFPALRRAVDGGAFDPPEMERFADFDTDFSFGLECILDGIEQKILRRGAEGGSSSGPPGGSGGSSRGDGSGER
jgi:AcrR family transcriptional regulator